MKKYFAMLFALFLVLALASASVAAKKTGTGKKELGDTVEVTGKITLINAAACKVSIKEQNGQIKAYQVPPQICGSLSQYKAGDTVTATLETDTTTGSSVMRSFIRRR